MSAGHVSALVHEALVALGRGERDVARSLLAAAPSGSSPLVSALSVHLAREPSGGAYDSGGAFESFISSGGNVRLYQRVEAELREVHERRRPRRVLDVGCGDGRVTAAVLASGTEHVDLVEPSARLLADARARFTDPQPRVDSHPVTIGSYLASDPEARWEVVQATFALHNLAPADRVPVLAELAARTEALVLAEFDVPELEDRSPEHLAYLAERYERGVAEHDEAAVQGFLMPVLVGQVAPGAVRHTYEQPASRWEHELGGAGFAHTRVEPLTDYWWAAGVLIEASHDPV